MKLVLAIVNNDDSHTLSAGLTRAHFSVTKLATTGGFLMSGNTTFLIGTEDDKVDQVIEIISQHSRRRKEQVSAAAAYGVDMFGIGSMPVEVTVGGATVFVLPVDRFEKL